MDRYTDRVARPTMNTGAAPERKEEPSRGEPTVIRKQSSQSGGDKKKYTVKALIGAAGLVVLAGLLWWFFLRNIGIPSYVDTSKYQVVCLQSGECYFGKITAVSPEDVQLKNVFYVQKTTSASTDTTDTTASDNNLQLIKLGNEVHGPEDMMVINRSQVLYMENLKSDGKVTQTINQYYEQNK